MDLGHIPRTRFSGVGLSIKESSRFAREVFVGGRDTFPFSIQISEAIKNRLGTLNPSGVHLSLLVTGTPCWYGNAENCLSLTGKLLDRNPGLILEGQNHGPIEFGRKAVVALRASTAASVRPPFLMWPNPV